MLGTFSLEEYNVFTTAGAAQGMMFYIASILGLCGIVYTFYPDKPAVPRTFPGGLDVELGGEGALLVCFNHGCKLWLMSLTFCRHRPMLIKDT